VESRLLDEEAEQKIDSEVNAAVAAAVAAADAAAEPTDATRFVYAKPIEPHVAVTEVEPEPSGESVNLITAVNRSMHEVMDHYPEVMTFGEDVADPKGGVFKATVGLTEKYGVDRSFNSPLAESLIIGLGIGIAAAGGKPIPEIQFADFIHPGFDQLVSEAARIHFRSGGRWTCQMVVRVPYGGGINGSLYHSQSIEAFYAHVPGLKVVVPSTPADVKGLLFTAVEDPDPVMVLEPKKLYRMATGPFPEGEHRVPFGRAALRRKGADLTIIAYGTMAHFAVEAAERLAGEGIDVTVLDLRSLRPLDWPSIEAAVRHNGKALVVHEDNGFGGFGAEISAQISERAFDWLDAPVVRYTSPEVPTFPFSQALESAVMPSVDGIVEHARKLAVY
jgi:2-oxoisovalerate dehydrogenase E1 component beta subunit